MMDFEYFLEKLFYFLVFILFIQHRCLLHIHRKKSPLPSQKIKKRKYLEFFNKTGELYTNAEKGQCQNTDYVKFENAQCIPNDQIEIPLYNGQECVLGRGAHGVVIKGKFHNKYVALKRFEVNIDNLEEFNIMKKLNHCNIVNIIGIVKEPRIMLVMDYIEFGSLKEFLLNYDVSKLEELQLLKYAQDIASGMEYLETKKIIHRDFATRNILIDSKDQLKISDFGLAKCLQPGNYIYSIGTARPLPFKWYSPEAIKPGPVFSHKSDVWSFGVTLWEMFNLGRDPNYPLQNPNSVSELLQFFKDGKRLLKPDKNIPNTETIWPTIQNCWIFEPEARPNFSILKENLTNLKIIYEIF